MLLIVSTHRYSKVYMASLSLQVVVTIPLAVLKAGVVSFSPSLTAGKVEAIERLGAGLVEKVRVQTWLCELLPLAAIQCI